MPIRFIFCAAVLLLSVVLPSVLSAADDKDIIFRKNGTRISGYVESENTQGVLYRTIKSNSGAPATKANQLKINELDKIIYNGMDSGPYGKAVSERDAGNYEVAAEFFNQAVLAGTREWEKVYGSIAEGESWELAKKYKEAAKAFQLVVDGFAGDPTTKPPVPSHRVWLDIKYRYGMALAQAKDSAAVKVADELEAFGRKEGLNAAEARANAIRAALAVGENNANKFSEFMKKATVRALDEPEVWFHFKLYCAEALRVTFKKNKDAVSVYREILVGLRDDPARQAQISLGLGITLMENDKQGALAELLKLDVLPFGSPDQKCEARYFAGRLLWDEAQAIKNNAEAMKDERKALFVKETERAARLVTTAAADGPVNNPNVELAKSLLKSFGPDPDAVKEEAKPKTAPPAPTPEPAPVKKEETKKDDKKKDDKKNDKKDDKKDDKKKDKKDDKKDDKK
jgi:hypothetical protein